MTIKTIKYGWGLTSSEVRESGFESLQDAIEDAKEYVNSNPGVSFWDPDMAKFRGFQNGEEVVVYFSSYKIYDYESLATRFIESMLEDVFHNWAVEEGGEFVSGYLSSPVWKEGKTKLIKTLKSILKEAPEGWQRQNLRTLLFVSNKHEKR